MPNDWYFERQAAEPVEAICAEDSGPYYSHGFEVTVDTLAEVKGPTADAARLYSTYLEKISSGMGGGIQLEVYLRGILGITKPLERAGGPKGTIIVLPDSKLFQNCKQRFLKGWEKTLFDNSLVTLVPDRNKPGVASMDEVEAGIVKAIVTVHFGGSRTTAEEIAKVMKDPANLEEIYEILSNPGRLAIVLKRWFEQHPTQGTAIIAPGHQLEQRRKQGRKGIDSGRVLGWLGVGRVDDLERDIDNSEPNGDWKGHPNAEEFWPEDYKRSTSRTTK